MQFRNRDVHFTYIMLFQRIIHGEMPMTTYDTDFCLQNKEKFHLWNFFFILYSPFVILKVATSGGNFFQVWALTTFAARRILAAEAKLKQLLAMEQYKALQLEQVYRRGLPNERLQQKWR